MGMISRGKDGNPIFWPDTPELITIPKQSIWNKIKRWMRKIFGITVIEFVNGSKIVVSHKLNPLRSSVKAYAIDNAGHIGPVLQSDSDSFKYTTKA